MPPSGRLVRVHLPLQQGLRPPKRLLTNSLSNSASASSITTRIKTIVFAFYIHISLVRLHLPLQQGLRPEKSFSVCPSSSRASASSITTRIKTVNKSKNFFVGRGASASSITTRIKTPSHYWQEVVATFSGASASSITTRIKTSRVFVLDPSLKAVRVHLPLQQGLRRD